jgi:outer membrane protein OmpA-like peptidoglycan-associated protein
LFYGGLIAQVALDSVLVHAVKLDSLRFDLGKATLRPESYPVLDKVAEFLTCNNAVVLEVGSHLDSRANSAAMCTRLSAARAQSVADYLVNKKHISPRRVVPKGYGEYKPAKLADGTVLTEKYILSRPVAEREALYALNRRTEIKVLSFDAPAETTTE